MLREIINEGDNNKKNKRNKYQQLVINYNSFKPSNKFLKVNQKSKINNISTNKIKTQRSSSVGSQQNSLKNTINNVPFYQNISTSMNSFQNIINYNTNSPILNNKAFSSENSINENDIIYNNNNNKDLLKEENHIRVNLVEKKFNRTNSCNNLLNNLNNQSSPSLNNKNLSVSNSDDKIQLL